MTMETNNKVVLGVVTLLSILALGLGLLNWLSGNSEQLQQVGSVQTTATKVTNPDTVTNMGGLYVWGTDANEGLEVAGQSLLGRLTQGGTVTAKTGVVTSTLTAAEVCASSYLSVAPVTGTPTITLPATSTLFASTGCLLGNGAFIDVNYGAVSTSSIIAAGTGGTLLNSSSTTVAAGKGAIIRIIRTSATAYVAFLVNLVN